MVGIHVDIGVGDDLFEPTDRIEVRAVPRDADADGTAPPAGLGIASARFAELTEQCGIAGDIGNAHRIVEDFIGNP